MERKIHKKIKAIRDQIASAPTIPGVYLFRGSEGDVLYVGKAKNIQKRLSQHFSDRTLRQEPRKALILNRVSSLEWFPTPTEDDAFFVENQYIKKYQPPFNVLLRDDKSFPYLKVTLSHDFPKLMVVRRVTPGQDLMIGPFRSSALVKDMIEVCISLFKIRSCSDHFFKVTRRPCMEYQLGRCRAPCVGYETRVGYQTEVERMLLMLTGREKTLLRELKASMAVLSKKEEYTEAAVIRDQIRTIEQFVQTHAAEFSGVRGHVDFIGVQKGRVGILHVRYGVISGLSFPLAEPPSHLQSDHELLEEVLTHYGTRLVVPSKILLAIDSFTSGGDTKTCLSRHEIKRLQDLILRQSGQTCRISAPRRPQEKKLMTFLFTRLGERGEKAGGKKVGTFFQPSLLQDFCHLDRMPKRFECIDISHFQGAFMVAGVVVFDLYGPVKEAYRYYKIRDPHISDTASIAEVCERRYGAHQESLPDMLLVDGGRGQVNAALKVIRAHKLHDHIRVVGISKNRNTRYGGERLHFDFSAKPQVLYVTHPLYRFFVSLRDEAHRFCNAYQRRKFRKAMGQPQALTAIRGLGEKRAKVVKELLVRHGVGGILDMSSAPVGIPDDVWKRVIQWAKTIL